MNFPPPRCFSQIDFHIKPESLQLFLLLYLRSRLQFEVQINSFWEFTLTPVYEHLTNARGEATLTCSYMHVTKQAYERLADTLSEACLGDFSGKVLSAELASGGASKNPEG